MLAESIAHESKVGFQTLTWDIRRQIAKDAWLLKTGQVTGAVWHFFRSSVTGKIGAADELLELLKKYGIKIVSHD